MQESESEHRFTKLQAISISLIQTDLRFIFTAVKNSERFKSNYWVSLMPYIGVVVDGAEDWLKAYNRCSKRKLVVPTFTVTSDDATLVCAVLNLCRYIVEGFFVNRFLLLLL